MKRILIYSLIIVAAFAIGTTAGVIGKRFLASEELDYGDLDVFSMKPDCDEIVKKVESYSGNKDLVDVFSASDVLNYSMEKFRRCENSFSFTFGLADTIVKQDIRSCTIRNGNNYFEESISKSSAVALGNRMYQENKDGNVTTYFGDSKSIKIGDFITTVSYSLENKKVFEHDEYRQTYGKTLDETFIYLVSEETVLESKVIKNDETYNINVTLDPVVSTYFYKLQMKNVSNLDKLPNFSSVKLEFVLTKDLSLKNLFVDEDYIATIMVDAKTHGTLEYYFYPNEFLKIPELNETLTYKKGD